MMKSTDKQLAVESLYSIVIPCKNEEEHIGQLLEAISHQSVYTSNVPIIIADAGSTDKTLEIIDHYATVRKMNIQVVTGGYPATGRNNGAAYARSKYVFFFDADILPGTETLIEDCLKKMLDKDLDCMTAFIKASNGNWKDHLFWTIHNVILSLFYIFGPFSAGMFMCFKLQTFRVMGGFNEQIILGEDFDLTHRVKRSKFGVVNNFIWNTNRRFMKMGYIKTISMYTRVAFSRNYRLQNHKEYFEV